MTRAQWGSVVGKAIGLQWAVIFGIAAVAWVLTGEPSAVSVIAGGAAIAVPNSILALVLWLKARQVGLLSVTTFLLGEGLKLALTVALLALVIKELTPGIVWLALVLGVIGALKAQWLALWFTRND